MKRKMVFTGLLCLFLAICVIFVIKIERNKQSPLERIKEHEQSSANVENATSSPNEDVQIVDSNSTSSEETPSNVIYNDHVTLEYNVLSYEVYDDSNILEQTQFPSEYFVDGEYPDPNYVYTGTNFHQMRIDYPEVDEYLNLDYEDYINSDFDYDAFLAEHGSEYYIEEHPDTRYLFVTYEVTNISESEVYEPVTLYICVENDEQAYDPGYDFTYAMKEYFSYFDYLPDLEGDERAHYTGWYRFEPGESHTFTVGYTIRAYPERDTPLVFTDHDVYYICNPYPDESVTTPADFRRVVCLNELP